MPYRVDIRDARDPALERLIDLGALDVERVNDRGVAAIMPDGVTAADIARAVDGAEVSVSPAEGRDADSVWILTRRPMRLGRVLILPADVAAEPGAMRLIDSPAFGTGLHPTTSLCLEALDEALQADAIDTVLDLGTGSGVLALAALTLGVGHATGVDIDDEALRTAFENARINGLGERLTLVHGTVEALEGTWPLVLANVLAAPLIEMAPRVVRRVAHRGRVVLSGMPESLAREVGDAYLRLGMRRVDVKSRAGWAAIVLQATW
jgi:ribosomal protein L11 methyltransferase